MENLETLNGENIFSFIYLRKLRARPIYRAIALIVSIMLQKKKNAFIIADVENLL